MSDRGDRRGILRDGALMAVAVLAVFAVRVIWHDEIDPWAFPLARRLSGPTLALWAMGCAAVWLVMAVRGADRPLDRWYARFVAGSFWIALALLFALTRWPMMTLLVIGIVVWATAGMFGAMGGRYLAGSWRAWLLAAAVLAALVALRAWAT